MACAVTREVLSDCVSVCVGWGGVRVGPPPLPVSVTSLLCAYPSPFLPGSPSGDASLQNALDLSVSLLRAVPPYGHREVLLLFAALATCDPGNVLDSVRAAKEQHIRGGGTKGRG